MSLESLCRELGGHLHEVAGTLICSVNLASTYSDVGMLVDYVSEFAEAARRYRRPVMLRFVYDVPDRMGETSYILWDPERAVFEVRFERAVPAAEPLMVKEVLPRVIKGRERVMGIDVDVEARIERGPYYALLGYYAVSSAHAIVPGYVDPSVLRTVAARASELAKEYARRAVKELVVVELPA